MSRTLEDWQGIVRQMVSLETSSNLSDEAKMIDAHALKAAMDVVTGNIEDVMLKRKIATTFAIRTRFAALHEIIELHLVDDPELAIEIAEAAGGAVVARRDYLT